MHRSPAAPSAPATGRSSRATSRADRKQQRLRNEYERALARTQARAARGAERNARRQLRRARRARRNVGGRLGRAVGYALPLLSAGIAVTYLAGVLVLGTNPPAAPIRGTSMNPLLHQGDLVLLQKIDPEQLKVGDLIGFRTTDLTQMTYAVPGQIVHRIVSIGRGNAGLVFTTQGDNNAEADPFRTLNSNVIGRVDHFVPYAGFPFLYADTTQAKLVGALGLVLFLVWLVIGWVESRSKEAARREALLAEMMGELPHIREQLDALQREARRAAPFQRSAKSAAAGPPPSDV